MLQQLIRSACDNAGGWIPFSEFMNITLYQPGLGYYSGGLQKFGERGDFITAPEVSPFFGQCFGNQIAEVLKNIRQTSADEVSLLEFGAGSGILAADILLALEKLGSLPDRYLIIELSAELKQRQSETLRTRAPQLFDYVTWLDQMPDDVNNAVVIANEVLDAMPVECFRVKDSRIDALMIGLENGRLVAAYKPATAFIKQHISVVQQRSEIEFAENLAGEGYCSEFNPAIGAWLAALKNKVQKLVIFIIDYGYNEKEYYHADRTSGTLMCYYRHRAHSDFLWWPGLQDITAFVDFTDIAYNAVDLELDISGYTTQAAFLLANGLSELHAEQVTDDVRQQVKLSQQIKTLTLPSEMGERFKVMALTRNYDEPLTGFSMLDLSDRL